MYKTTNNEHNCIMFIVFFRVTIIYITVLIFLRLMGKRQIGEMQPYEVVITLIIADLATLPMSETNIPLLNGILPLAILVLVHHFITFLIKKSIKIRRILSGSPMIIISPTGIEQKTLTKLNMNLDDLMEMIRQNGYYSFDQILYAIIETNGKMSIIPKSANAPATAQDVGVNNPPAKLPSIIVSDGKIMQNQMKEVNLTCESLNKILNHIKVKSINDLIILSIDEDGKIFYQTKTEKCQTVENINKEISLWNFGLPC